MRRRQVFGAITAVLIFLLPVVSSMGSLVTVGPLALARPLAAVLVVTALLSLERWTRLASWILGLAIIWLGLGILGLRSTENANEWLSVALGMATILACVVYVRDRGTLRLMTRSWLFAWAVAALPGFWEIASGNHLPNYLEGSDGWVREASTDIASFLVNPNAFAYFLAASMVFVALGLRLEIGPLRGLNLAALLLTPVLAFFAGARTIMAVSAVILLWAVWDRGWFRRFHGWLVPLGGLGSTLAVLAVALSPSAQAALADQIAGSGIERFNLYRNGWWMFVTTGGVGVGPGRFEDTIAGRWAPYDTGSAVNPHSGVFEILSQYGLVVAALIGAGLLSVAVIGSRGFLRSFPDAEERFMHQVLLVTAVTMPLTSFGNSTFLPSPIPWAETGMLLAVLAVIQLTGRGPEPDWLARTQAVAALPRAWWRVRRSDAAPG